MVLRLYPLPSLFDEAIATVKASTPVDVSSLYLRRPHMVPWSVDPTAFVLETDEPGTMHHFSINRTEQFAIIPGASSFPMTIQLAKGANRIDVSTDTQTLYVTVGATAIETWFKALGREFYLAVQKRLRDVTDHFSTPWTTRTSAHLLPYTDLFLPARMPKIQQTRLAILTSMGGRLGMGDGVRTIATAVSYSTPFVSQTENAEFSVPGLHHNYPGVTSHPTAGELQGRLFDLWYPNQCLATKDALIRLALSVGAADVPSPKPLELVDFNDLEVLLRSNGGDIEAHLLNPLSPECADIEFNTSCDGAVRVFVMAESTYDMVMSTPQFTADGEVVENLLNFGFWDSGNLLDGGLGGSGTYDTVDPGDLFGDGFFDFDLTRSLDYSCGVTRVQTGARMVKYVPPIAGQVSLTPADKTAGLPLVIDAKDGAPAPDFGASVIWGVSPRLFIYEGDYIRFEAPDAEIQVVSAWPVLESDDFVVKTTDVATFTASGTNVVVVTAPADFFEARHKGMGLRIDGTELYSIVNVTADGTAALIAGNPATPPAGPFTAEVYEPMRDRNETAFLAGRRTYEITLATTLLATYPDGTLLDLRWAPRAEVPATAGDTSFELASDVVPREGDRIYLTPSTFVSVTSATVSGTHETMPFPVYDVEVSPALPANLTRNQALYALRADACYPNGDPVTPLSVISFVPATYLTV